MTRPRILLVCGSLRAQSSNRAILQAFAHVLGPRATVTEGENLGLLPHFNPDADADPLPAAVVAWRQAVGTADAMVISTPEYAHGLPGSFKNALDWLVSDPAVMGRRVAILAADRGSTWASDSLREILRTMSADLREDASVSLRLSTNRRTAEEILQEPELRAPLEAAATALLAALPPGA